MKPRRIIRKFARYKDGSEAIVGFLNKDKCSQKRRLLEPAPRGVPDETQRREFWARDNARFQFLFLEQLFSSSILQSEIIFHTTDQFWQDKNYVKYISTVSQEFGLVSTPSRLIIEHYKSLFPFCAAYCSVFISLTALPVDISEYLIPKLGNGSFQHFLKSGFIIIQGEADLVQIKEQVKICV